MFGAFKLLMDLLPGIVVFLRKMGCMFAGEFCGFMEVLDAVVNIIWTPLSFLVGPLPIACGANQLERINCECSGYLFSGDPAGTRTPCTTARPWRNTRVRARRCDAYC